MGVQGNSRISGVSARPPHRHRGKKHSCVRQVLRGGRHQGSAGDVASERHRVRHRAYCWHHSVISPGKRHVSNAESPGGNSFRHGHGTSLQQTPEKRSGKRPAVHHRRRSW
eukprot:3049468-Rhodomonas_salina.3